MAFSDLRGQLIHLTGQDPLQENHPLGSLPIKVHLLCWEESGLVFWLMFLLPFLYVCMHVRVYAVSLEYVNHAR